MATGEILKSFFLLLQAAAAVAAVTATVDTVVNCGISLCGGDGGFSALIEFPFRLKSVQHRRCGFPGFDLTCNNQSQTILTIPNSGDFSVEFIDYQSQRIWLNDPDHCLPKRLLNFSLSASQFRPLITRNFTLLNCSGDAMADVMASYTPGLMTVPCMSGANHTVVSVPSRFCCGGGQRGCEVVGAISVPVLWPYMADLDEAIQLTWDAPKCGECVARGGHCGYMTTDNGSESEIGCSISLPRQGLSRGAKYGIILGVGVPGIMCLLGLACFACGRIRIRGRRQLPTVDFSTVTGTLPVLLSVGLDGPTIESYPKTLLGESKRLPKSSDTTCSICLCEYQPDETLRTIPDCNHYFHVECVDEWLRLNGTCPLCRNSPEGSSRATSSSLSIDSSVAATSSSD